MINLNRPASTKHNSASAQNTRKMPGFFHKSGIDGERYTSSAQYQYNKPGTPKTMKSASIGGPTGGSKKAGHYMSSSQGYGLMPGSTRAHTASTRPTTTGGVYDQHTGHDFNNTTTGISMSSGQYGGAAGMKYGNLLKLNMPDEMEGQQQRGSSLGPDKGQTRHNSLPRNDKS